MLILDDDPTFRSQSHDGYTIEAHDSRFPTISHKYNRLLELCPEGIDIVITWEDDDIYLPEYVSSHIFAMMKNNAEFSKSDVVLSDFTGKVAREPSRGRFHSSLAISMDLVKRIGGWPNTRRADFDQQLMSKLYEEARGVTKPWLDDAPDNEIPFIYRWHSGAAHCQSTMDKGPEDETWYDRGEQAYRKVPFVGELLPEFDGFTKSVLTTRDIPW